MSNEEKRLYLRQSILYLTKSRDSRFGDKPQPFLPSLSEVNTEFVLVSSIFCKTVSTSEIKHTQCQQKLTSWLFH